MKKILTAIFLLLIFITILFLELKKTDKHKVLKVISSVEFYIDYNDNQTADTDELTELSHLDIEPDSLSKIEALKLNYLGKNFAKEHILNKYVTVKRGGNITITLADLKDYEKLLIQNGFVLTKDNAKKVKENLKYADTLNLVSYNTNTHKYHKLECKYAFNSPFSQIIKLADVSKKAKPCKFCNITKTLPKKNQEYKINKYPKNVYEKYSPVYKDNYLEFYVTDFTKYYYPSDKCLTTPCKSLLREINAARYSIDFAIYGIDKQPEITKALINAQNRGVKIRWVFDTDKTGQTIYAETLILKNTLRNYKRDIDLSSSSSAQYIKDAIMHNKFFIFDNQKVWTGSANISHTDLSGFNANSAILINSCAVAEVYKQEFEQMYDGKFHQMKTSFERNKLKLGPSKISVHFSPQDNTITKQIIPLINNSTKYVYIPVFVITHKDFNTALINASQRGVDVKIIVDATSAGSKYSSVKYLRDNNIKVKTENRAGKMHMKSIIIDDRYCVLGSMNFTKSGESYNDENILIIENTALAEAFKERFLSFWSQIPEKWLYKNPGAESLNSINSCYDGIDNDFDGKIDMNDDSCNFLLKNKNTTRKK